MTEVYLFDWGDTLMVDTPGVPGKMCDWEQVAAVEGALEALQYLAEGSKIYVATSAADSTEADIERAFRRVGLDKYISGYFCKANLGLEKGSPEFLTAILKELGKQPGQVTMVGDNLNKDIEPALKVGLNAILLSKGGRPNNRSEFITITSLFELCHDS